MIEGLKPYTDYKESGLPWLDNFPAHWSTRRMKVLFKERVEKGFPHEPLLAATQTKGVVRKEDYGERTVTASKDFHLLKLVELDDFVISLRSFQGGIEYSRCRGIISPAYTVLTPRPGTTRGYYSYFLKSKPFVDSLTLFVTGIREGQNIEYPRLARAYMPLPPPDEQAAIVRFLDYANGKIERAIRAKRKLIGLLNEQKQAIIHRAVTRGLDPNVKLKSSGVPWLGDVPEHWEVLRVKFAAKKISKGDTPSNFGREFADGGPVRFIKIENIGVGEILEAPHHTIDLETHGMLRRSHLQEDDIVYAISGATTGKAALVRKHHLPANTNQAVAFIRPNARILPSYLVTWLHAPELKKAMWLLTVTSAQPNLSMEELGNLPLLLPPKHEQAHIFDNIRTEQAPLDEVIVRTEREIALLREYRTTLTAEVVTGKLDVREASKRLPDQTDDPLPADESLDDLVDDEITEEDEA
jgi:type I restriction enzyme, S subunit